MVDVTPETAATGGGVAGAIGAAIIAWAKGRFFSSGDRTAEKAHEEIDQVKERLTRIESQLDAVRADNSRNETGIAEVRAKIDSMHQASTTAQIELATTLGRIEGALGRKP